MYKIVKLISNSISHKRQMSMKWGSLIYSVYFMIAGVPVCASQSSRAAPGVAPAPRVRAYCPWQTFTAECPRRDQLLRVRSAQYGRMRLGTCIRNDLGYIGCTADVLAQAHRACSGRRRCQVRVPNAEMERAKTCLEDLQSYLEISYECVKVITPVTNRCNPNSFIRVTRPTGILSSLVTHETGCGTKQSPWIIEAHANQQINITLIDYAFYGVTQTEGEATKTRRKTPCIPYGTVAETNGKTESRVVRTICGGGGVHKSTQQFLTRGSSVEIAFAPRVNSERQNYFFIHYQVIGCGTPKLHNGIISELKKNTAIVSCPESKRKWKIHCRNGKWDHISVNCSSMPSYGEIRSETDVVLGSLTIPYATAISLIVGVALVIGLGTLLAGMICLKYSTRQTAYPATTALSASSPYYREVASSAPVPIKDKRYGGASANEYASICDSPLPAPPGALSPHHRSTQAHLEPLLTGRTRGTTDRSIYDCVEPRSPPPHAVSAGLREFEPTRRLQSENLHDVIDVNCARCRPQYFDLESTASCDVIENDFCETPPPLPCSES